MVPLTQTIISFTPENGGISLVPDDRRSIFVASEPLIGPYDLIIDSTNAQTGDQVVIIFDVGISTISGVSISSTTINFDSNIVITFCGNTTSSEELTHNDTAQYMFDFYYDGEYFVNTLDLG